MALTNSNRNVTVSAIGIGCLTILLSMGTAAAQNHGVDLRCAPPQGHQVRCDFRLWEPRTVKVPKVEIGGKPLTVPQVSPYPYDAGQRSAFMFLVDTSTGERGKRTKTVSDQRDLIEGLVKKMASHHAIGILGFANTSKILADVGAPQAELLEAAKKLKAEGLNTALYRAVTEGSERLKNIKATRKALILLSDGAAEDNGFTLNQAIAAANDAGVVIYGLGYAEAGDERVLLQPLELLAKGTGGPYAEADLRKKTLPKETVEKFFDYLDNGGLIAIDAAGYYGKQTLTFSFPSPTGTPSTATVDVDFPAQPPAAAPSPNPAVPSPQATKPQQLPPKVEPTGWAAVEQWVAENRILAGGLALAALALAGFLVWSAMRKPEPEEEVEEKLPTIPRPVTAPTPPPQPQAPVVGWLELLDADRRRIPMRAQAIRIGRSPENDVTFANDSVSTFHATLHWQRGGGFMITDLDSSNGTLVNDKEVKQCTLSSGDIVEVGEVRMRYIVNSDTTRGASS